MSDFDAFESAAPQQEEDPAAEFLAREQDQLAELEDDNFVITDAAPPAENAGGEADFFAAEPEAAPAAAATTEEPEPVAAGGDVAPSSGDILDYSSPSPPEFDSTQPTEQSLDDDFAVQNGPTDGYSAISMADKMRAEPEKIKKWREDQKERLEKKDVDSEAKKGEWREAARKELEDWYKHREEQLEKTRENNRQAEVAFVQDRDETVPGHEWERICRLCEFNPKTVKAQKDVSRMRSILLQLKQTPLVR